MKLPDRLLLEVGRVVRPSQQRTLQLIETMSPDDTAAFLDLVKFHKVAPQVHLNLSRSAGDQPTGAYLLQKLTSEAQHSERFLARHREKLEELAARSGISFTAIKGTATAGLYGAETGCRQIADADIVISWQNAWRMFEYLALSEHKFLKIRFGSSHAHRSDDTYPPYYGVCPAMRQLPEGKFFLDVHFGAFPACGHGLISLEEGDTVADPSGVRRPTAQKSLIIILAHAIRQGFCRLRDINDLYLLARSMEGEQADGLLAEARRTHLFPLLRSMLRITCTVYGTDLAVANAAGVQGRMRWADRELLLGRRQHAMGYIEDVRMLWSRSWQLRYLTALHGELSGPAGGILRAAVDAPLLFRTGRPYQLWHGARNLDTDERFVVRPVSTLDRPVDEISIRERLETAGWLVKRNARFDLWQIRAPAGPEFIVAGRLVCAQTDYSGAELDQRAIAGPLRDLAGVAQVECRLLT